MSSGSNRGFGFGRIEAKPRRQRFHPRTIEVLRRLDNSASRLCWDDEHGRYRINGEKRRMDTVQPRTMGRLDRARAVQPVLSSRDFVISKAGRAVVQKFRHYTIETKARRASKMAIRTLERVQRVQLLAVDGRNFRDVHALLGADLWEPRYNPEQDRIEVLVHVSNGVREVAEPGQSYILREGETVQVLATAAVLSEMNAKHGWRECEQDGQQ